MSKSILLIEDDELITSLLQAMMEDNGIDVDIALNGEIAISTFLKNSTQYDLVITDYNLPDMNAEEIVEKIIKINPSQRIVVSSGMTYDQTHHLLKKGVESILSKPFKQEDILELI